MCSLSAGTAGSFVVASVFDCARGPSSVASFDASGRGILTARELFPAATWHGFPRENQPKPDRNLTAIRAESRLRSGDGHQRPESEVWPDSLRRRVRQLHAAEALLRSIRVTREVVYGLAGVEVGYPRDGIGVLRPVGVPSPHDLMLVPEIHRVSADRCRRDRDAGIGHMGED